MKTKTPSEARAYTQGFEARAKQIAWLDNPFDPRADRRLWLLWFKGWVDAEHDK